MNHQCTMHISRVIDGQVAVKLSSDFSVSSSVSALGSSRGRNEGNFCRECEPKYTKTKERLRINDAAGIASVDKSSRFVYRM